MKKILVLITLLISVFGSVNAQSLDDLRQKAYEAAIEAVNKGKNEKSAYEEYLERQELEAAKKAEEEALEEEAEEEEAEEEEALEEEAEAEVEDDYEYWRAIDILHRCVFCEPINKNIIVKCYCYPIEDFIWYRAFIGTDDKIWVNLAYDDNGEIGEVFYASAMQERESTSAIESETGIKTPALKVTFTSGELLFIQDIFDPYQFGIAW